MEPRDLKLLDLFVGAADEVTEAGKEAVKAVIVANQAVEEANVSESHDTNHPRGLQKAREALQTAQKASSSADAEMLASHSQKL